MNLLLWGLQVLAALLYGASGIMKVFLFERVRDQVPSFGALPRRAWALLGTLELGCTVGLLVPTLTALAAAILACESVVFVWVHVRYREVGSIVVSGALGLVMALLAIARW